MKLLFVINHPAHVHLFKNFIFYLHKKQIAYDVYSRDKDVVTALLTYYRIPHTVISKARFGWISLFLEMLVRDVKLFFAYQKNRYCFAFGTSVAIGHLSMVTPMKSFVFNEDDDDVVPLFSNLAYPFATRIINPDCVSFRKWRNKRDCVASYHELAYLHPDNFTPDIAVLEKYGLNKKNISLPDSPHLPLITT